MTTIPKRRFNREFKLEVLRQVELRPAAEVCREHNLHPTLVNRWKREQQRYPKDAFKGKGRAYTADAEIARLERLVGQLYAENTFLKKGVQRLQERKAEEKMLRSTP